MPAVSDGKGAHWHRKDRVKRCVRCGEEKPLSSFYAYGYTTRQGKQSTRYESRCMDCSRERRKEYYSDNINACQATAAEWKRRNREHLRAYNKERQRDPEYRRNKAKAQRARKARMRSGADNKDPRIAALYQEAMDWEKKLEACVISDDPIDLKVHVDHIVPLALGGKHVFENLQILDARINMQKGAKPHSAWTRSAPDASGI